MQATIVCIVAFTEVYGGYLCCITKVKHSRLLSFLLLLNLHTRNVNILLNKNNTYRVPSHMSNDIAATEDLRVPAPTNMAGVHGKSCRDIYDININGGSS